MNQKYRVEVRLKNGNVQDGTSFTLHRKEFDDDIQFCQAVASTLFGVLQHDRISKTLIEVDDDIKSA